MSERVSEWLDYRCLKLWKITGLLWVVVVCRAWLWSLSPTCEACISAANPFCEQRFDDPCPAVVVVDARTRVVCLIYLQVAPRHTGMVG